MKKLITALLTATLCMSLLTACGSTAKDNTTEEAEVITEASTEVADTSTEEPEDKGEETAVSEALSDGVLNVGTNAEFPPFEYVNDIGEPDGFDIALIKAIGEKLGVEVVVDNMEFASLVSSIGSKIDVSIAGMTITDERKEAVDFSNPYYTAVQYVILPVGSTIQSADDLKGKAIGVQLGTTGDFIAEEIEGSSVAQYNKAVDAVNDLVNGRLDCVIIDKNPALVFAEKFGDKVSLLEGEQFAFEAEEYAIAMPKGDTVLLEQINKALSEIMEDGTFDTLVSQYIEEN